jgi:hypothetical protein
MKDEGRRREEEEEGEERKKKRGKRGRRRGGREEVASRVLRSLAFLGGDADRLGGVRRRSSDIL